MKELQLNQKMGINMKSMTNLTGKAHYRDQKDMIKIKNMRNLIGTKNMISMTKMKVNTFQEDKCKN